MTAESVESVCWIQTIPEAEAEGAVAEAYAAVRRPDGSVHNLYKAFSLWPETMAPADALYKAMLHGGDSTLPPWFLELVATSVAWLCECEYAAAHHGARFERLLGDADRAACMHEAVREGTATIALDTAQNALLAYARKLTLEPAAIGEEDLGELREAGVGDRELLEVNQLCAGFNYWVRVINGLGIRLGNERIGLD